MKLGRCLPTAAAILILSAASFANSVSHFSQSSSIRPINWLNLISMDNSGGTISYNPVSQTLTMSSTLTGVNFTGMDYSGDLGTVTFTTGVLLSGSIYTAAVFNSGTFTITSNGTDGMPNGVIYSGTFSSVEWREIGHTDQYFFSGYFGNGNMHETSVLISGTTQFNVISGATVVPEPGSWAMLGTGLWGIAVAIRKRRKSQSAERP